MLLSIFYMYSTLLQWWRLGALKIKLNGTLNVQNALLVCKDSVIYDPKNPRCLENLLFKHGDRIACTIVPKQLVNLSNWALFPKDADGFPIHFKHLMHSNKPPIIYILIQALLDSYTKHSGVVVNVEDFGDLIAWKISEHFEAILKTDMNKLTKLVNCFSQNEDIDINHELKLLRIETINIEGHAARVKYIRKFTIENQMKYSHSPVHWKKFSTDVRELYSKLRQEINPKITIESGSGASSTKSDEGKKVPVSEVKPIKKEIKKDDKHTLEVGTRPRHKSKDKSSDRQKLNDGKLVKEDKRNSREESHKIKSSKAKDELVHKKDLENDIIEVKEDTSKLVPTIVTEDVTDLLDRNHVPDQNVEGADSLESKKTLNCTSDQKHSKPRTDHKSEKDLKEKKHNKRVEKDKVKKESKIKEKDKRERKKLKEAFKSDSLGKRIEEPCSTNDLDAPFNGASQMNGSISNGKTPIKPPNILVYADSLIAKQNVKDVLENMINKERYIIYDLPINPTVQSWNVSTVLVVVCGTVPPNLTNHLLQYLLNGGQLLCLCSDLLYSVLYTFTTAEVREHELVRFSYDQWKQVKMMHHIFCYQASPAKKQFSKDSDHSNPGSGNGSSPIAPRTPSSVEIQHDGKDYIIQVQILGAEETWQTPSLLLATVKGSKGRAIFSQVHLEINPNQYEDDENKFSALKESDQARLEIFKDILSKHLDIDCSEYAAVPYTPAYFLGRHDLKLKLLSENEFIIDNKLTNSNLTVTFCGKNVEPEHPTRKNLPVLIHSCPQNFSTVKYFETLETESIGRLVIYSDILTTSQDILEKTLCHGLAVIVRQQTHGVGRSNNIWISPIGSALFSIQLHIDMNSPLGKALPLVQHLIMIAVLCGIKSFKGCEFLDLGLKWPNDLYANGNVKIGGMVVKSTHFNNFAIINAGVGVNLNNSNPTICLNDLIRNENQNFNKNIMDISYENYFAVVFNEIERLLKIIQDGNIDYLYELYYQFWLHKDAKITIQTKEGESRNVKVMGIDEYGFLKVVSSDGVVSSVEPDGNSFDIMKGLIAPKIF